MAYRSGPTITITMVLLAISALPAAPAATWRRLPGLGRRGEEARREWCHLIYSSRHRHDSHAAAAAAAAERIHVRLEAALWADCCHPTQNHGGESVAVHQASLHQPLLSFHLPLLSLHLPLLSLHHPSVPNCLRRQGIAFNRVPCLRRGLQALPLHLIQEKEQVLALLPRAMPPSAPAPAAATAAAPATGAAAKIRLLLPLLAAATAAAARQTELDNRGWSGSPARPPAAMLLQDAAEVGGGRAVLGVRAPAAAARLLRQRRPGVG